MSTLRLLTVGFLLSALALAGQAADRKQLQADVDAAIETFQRADPGLKGTFQQAAGYVVFPNVGKGGFILGGAHGNGQVYEAGKPSATPR